MSQQSLSSLTPSDPLMPCISSCFFHLETYSTSSPTKLQSIPTMSRSANVIIFLSANKTSTTGKRYPSKSCPSHDALKILTTISKFFLFSQICTSLACMLARHMSARPMQVLEASVVFLCANSTLTRAGGTPLDLNPSDADEKREMQKSSAMVFRTSFVSCVDTMSDVIFDSRTLFPRISETAISSPTSTMFLNKRRIHMESLCDSGLISWPQENKKSGNSKIS
mmetsp:Transcript_17582/g.57961  ORF Transcript_17582/g.57961 Transcript_17582/m.57961 type:complete len:224 (-) Transcript_17582:761-1432(-)